MTEPNIPLAQLADETAERFNQRFGRPPRWLVAADRDEPVAQVRWGQGSVIAEQAQYQAATQAQQAKIDQQPEYPYSHQAAGIIAGKIYYKCGGKNYQGQNGHQAM